MANILEEKLTPFLDRRFTLEQKLSRYMKLRSLVGSATQKKIALLFPLTATIQTMQLTKQLLRQIIGAVAFSYAIYPLVYARFDNVKDTGNAATDEVAEGVHDTLMSMLTFVTMFQAVGGLLVGLLAVYLLPDGMFEEEKKVVAA